MVGCWACAAAKPNSIAAAKTHAVLREMRFMGTPPLMRIVEYLALPAHCLRRPDMQPKTPVLAAAVLLAFQASALASAPFTSNHPEKAYPDNAPPLSSPGPYSDLVKQVQEKLHGEGFDAGPLNGDFGSKTQAALAQFQL